MSDSGRDQLKVLYCSQYYPPEMGAPAARVSELSQHWVQHGTSVTVLTGFPNHPTGVVHPDYRSKLHRLWLSENVNGVRVERTWLWPLPNRRSWERILNYSSFCVSAVLRGLFLPRPDFIVATSPQLLVGLAGLCIAKLRSIQLILEVRDLWPESLAAVGVSSDKSLLHRTLARIAGLLYRHCDHLVVVTPAFKEYLASHWHVPPDKISIIMNGVDTELFSPKGDASAMRKELGLDDRFTVSFIGTMGNAHGLETMIEAAKRMQESRPDIAFLIVGEGADKQKIQELAVHAQLRNLTILPQQERARVPKFVAASDICLVLLRRSEVFETVIPTKMLEFMACGRSVILGVKGQAKRIVEDAQAGVCITPESEDELVAAIERLHADASLRDTLGQNGHGYIVREFSRESTAVQYLVLLQKLDAAAPVADSTVVAG
jgi:glycosyltransferase involved in cell wall biosynthesis